MIDNTSSPAVRRTFFVCLAMGNAIGAGVGTAIGTAQADIGLWLALGIAIGNSMGLAIGIALAHAQKQQEDAAAGEDMAGAGEPGAD